ncbi:uncharacterized protein LOC27207964 [Drosophila simulans]|uniref:uncharacterized protein LOC27207964 n=1 Tax=Drosophila simulans TaxID=7240 RepID=UPI00078AEB4B|nr:uncharacterized protein LOC27207964 [Drosophila simulans]KMZ08622.1 uncharacterized protein Dsimw501_GD28115 [Drosophila simulans]
MFFVKQRTLAIGGIRHFRLDWQQLISCWSKGPEKTSATVLGSEKPIKRRYDCAESLLEQVSDPKELAKEVIKLARELRMERQKNEILMQSVLDLKDPKFFEQRNKNSNGRSK